MNVLGEVFFKLRQCVFLLNTLLYWFYLLLVFMSKPGAMWLVGVICHLLVFWLYHRAVGWPHYSLSDDYLAWGQTTVDWLSYDHHLRGNWIFIDVPLLAMGLFCQLFPPAILRAGLGMFPAKGRPLVPRRKVRAPKVKIKTAKVRIAI